MLQALPKRLRTKTVNKFLNPTRVVESLDIRRGDSILEVGVPVGFFAPALLNKVGVEGTVYVAGPHEESLSRLTHLAEKRGLVLCKLSDVLSDTTNDLAGVDVIILTNLLSNTLEPAPFCLAIGKYLHSESEVILIDWNTEDKNVGPAMERRVSKEDALKLMHNCGLHFKRILHLPGYHYGIVFGPTAE